MKILKQRTSVRNADISGKPKVISTFAGFGGSSLGYKWAGYEELLAVEWNKLAAENFILNFPDVPVWVRDISTIESAEILKFCNIKKRELDVFDGSPPCQGFSSLGKHEVNDNRNNLFKEYIRLVKGLEPKVFIMENVSGMIKGKMKGIFIEIMVELKKLDYNVQCKLMNAMYYNVPQSRQRLIFMGVRKDLDLLPVFPEPSKDLISVKNALNGVIPKTFSTNKIDYSELYSYLKPGKSITDCVPKDVILRFAPRFINNPKINYCRFWFKA